MKFFIKDPTTNEFVQVHKNNWKGEDIYIDDPFHNPLCWGDCYREEYFKK